LMLVLFPFIILEHQPDLKSFSFPF
jgi:hypothetical protein